MNAHLKTKLIADINALDGSEPLSELLVLAKACQPWLSEFTTQELAPLTNRVTTDLANADNSNTDDLLIASKILEAIDIASQPAHSPIKNIYRGVYNGRDDNEATITIPAVNMDKTVVNMLSNVSAASAATNDAHRKGGWVSNIYARLSSPTTLGVRNKVDTLQSQDSYYSLYASSWYVDIHWEVIEYA